VSAGRRHNTVLFFNFIARDLAELCTMIGHWHWSHCSQPSDPSICDVHSNLITRHQCQSTSSSSIR